MPLAKSIAEWQPQTHPLQPGRMRILPDVNSLWAVDVLGDIATLPGQCFGDLDSARAGTDDAPALAFGRNPMVPECGMERRTIEAIAAWDVGIERIAQESGCRDEDIGCRRLVPRRGEMPAAVGETSFNDLLLEPNEFAQAAIVRDLFDVCLDLRSGSILTRPIVVQPERKFILPRQDVDI